MESFAAVIDHWDSAEDLARDIGQKGVTVRQWRNRGSIPPEHWRPIIAAAERRGYQGFTFDTFVRLAEERRADGKDAAA